MDVEAGQTVQQLFNTVIPGAKAEDYLIRVNRQPVPRDHILQEGERVSFTPVKIEGVRSVCSKLTSLAA